MNLLEANKEELQELLNAVVIIADEEERHYRTHKKVLNRRDLRKEKKIDILQTWVAQVTNAIGIVEAREKAYMN